ncbi:hypothetical protein DPMN_041464 [Dreissena polymorpha]|uniref:Uncharacterized protein n=1 Tax=Dreissena polymorpha TaxID=45954 RepID=A0A9D4CZG2_DREPO|nr:hypothetical protein DPMN_041464 [Dreissena polymorpha]
MLCPYSVGNSCQAKKYYLYSEHTKYPMGHYRKIDRLLRSITRRMALNMVQRREHRHGDDFIVGKDIVSSVIRKTPVFRRYDSIRISARPYNITTSPSSRSTRQQQTSKTKLSISFVKCYSAS